MSDFKPRTIQIFLPDGNPRSVRMAEITSRTVHAIEIPRTRLDVAATRPETRQVGVYFLFGEDETHARPMVYIGESEDCYARLLQHHQHKEFWNRAVVVTSKTHRFDKAQARWLEWYAEREASRVGRYAVKNKVGPSEPHVTEPVRADLADSFDTLRVLLATLGFPVFEALQQASTPNEVFFCRGRGVVAQASYGDGMVVLKGSQASKKPTPSAKAYTARIRDKLFADGVLVDEDKHYVFTADHPFDTPTAATVAVLGRRSNGWEAWKDKQGRTLDEVKRQPLMHQAAGSSGTVEA